MQNWLKRSLLVLGVFGVCWIGAVWYWRSTTRMPDTGDLALAMLVMPLVLLSTLWLANKSFNAAPAVPTPVARAEDASEQAPAAGAAKAAAPWLPLAVAAAAVRMPHGDSQAELAAAIAEGQARLDLDPDLTDLQGFPLMAGRVASVDLEPLAEWLSTSHAGARAPAAHHQRAMALGGEVAAQLAAEAGSGSDDDVMQLVPLLPQDWPAATQQLALLWLQHSASAAGWPLDRMTVRQPLAGASPLAALRELSAQSATASAPAASILVAFDSSIDADAVEHLAVNGKLYGPRNQNGRMPAEGAAGILLLPPRQAKDELRLLALEGSKPDQPAQPLGELAKEVLAHAGGTTAAYVAADTDHRAAAMSDLMQCVESTAPELDTNTALACVGAACGHTGAAGTLAALALAHQQAADNGGFALALANADPTQRFALLVGPLPARPSSAPSLS